MAQGWDDGLVLPEGWQHHRYKVRHDIFFSVFHKNLIIEGECKLFHNLFEPQGRWPVCDKCGGENQTARLYLLSQNKLEHLFFVLANFSLYSAFSK